MKKAKDKITLCERHIRLDKRFFFIISQTMNGLNYSTD
jgi:hypothetical protein